MDCKKNIVDVGIIPSPAEWAQILAPTSIHRCASCRTKMEEHLKRGASVDESKKNNVSSMEDFKNKFASNTPVTIKESWDMFLSFSCNAESLGGKEIIFRDDVDDFLGIKRSS